MNKTEHAPSVLIVAIAIVIIVVSSIDIDRPFNIIVDLRIGVGLNRVTSLATAITTTPLIGIFPQFIRPKLNRRGPNAEQLTRHGVDPP